jgi:hypothetical protein
MKTSMASVRGKKELAATRNRATLESARYDLYGTGQKEIAFGTTLGMYVTQ